MKQMIYLILSIMISLTTNAATINDLKRALDRPVPTQRFKLSTDKWTLHNHIRELEIKQTLEKCKLERKLCSDYKELALDITPTVETQFIKNPSWTIAGISISFAVGLLAGALLID